MHTSLDSLNLHRYNGASFCNRRNLRILFSAFQRKIEAHFSKPISYPCRGYVLFHLFITHFNYIRIVQRFKTMGHPWGYSWYYFLYCNCNSRRSHHQCNILQAGGAALYAEGVVAQKAILQITGTSHRNQNFFKKIN